jgi:hypothetical protein
MNKKHMIMIFKGPMVSEDVNMGTKEVTMPMFQGSHYCKHLLFMNRVMKLRAMKLTALKGDRACSFPSWAKRQNPASLSL